MNSPKPAPSLPLVSPETTVRETMAVIDKGVRGIAIMVDAEKHLLATITDGDIRRALLAGFNLDLPVLRLKQPSADVPIRHPITAQMGAAPDDLIALMRKHSIRHVPLLDAEGRVSELVVLDELLSETELPVTGVIMAGGFGKRLRPLTESTPKPMLPVNGLPLLEHTLNKLRNAGIQAVHITTHYLGDRISDHFGNGSGFGLELTYVEEAQPLGTAAALAQVRPDKPHPLLVMNGDILTSVNVRAMLDFHHDHHACLTVGVRQYDIEVPFGVVETDGARVIGITEKPVLRQFINAGIYIVEPELCRLIPPGEHFDMPDLITAAIKEGGTVISFPVREYWLDIGRLEHYEKAGADLAEGVV